MQRGPGLGTFAGFLSRRESLPRPAALYAHEDITDFAADLDLPNEISCSRSCRKVAEAKLSGSNEIEIWGDGEQTRSFMYIDDCVYGTKAILDSGITEPINLGSSEMVTINQLVDIVDDIAVLQLERHYDLTAPKGVRGRNSDNSMILTKLGWEPSISLRTGLERTYAWIFDQISAVTVTR
jgi:nucleoside-diphosphate-sugar epimerase